MFYSLSLAWYICHGEKSLIDLMCQSVGVLFYFTVNARGKDGMSTEEMRKLIERSVALVWTKLTSRKVHHKPLFFKIFPFYIIWYLWGFKIHPLSIIGLHKVVKPRCNYFIFDKPSNQLQYHCIYHMYIVKNFSYFNQRL